MDHRVLVAAAVAALTGLVPGQAMAAKRPDLRVGSVRVANPSLEAGSKLGATIEVRNAGRGRARPSTARLYLSKDSRKSAGDVRLPAKLKSRGIARGGARTLSKGVKLPPEATGRSWVLLACADDGRANRESNERNNCTRAPGPVGILQRSDPARVSVQPLAEQRSDGVITPEDGGTVMALAGDTLYYLIVPPRAVATPTWVAVTPLAGAGGNPVAKGFIGGVQLEPEGLQLARAATLSVVREGLAPDARQVGLGYHGNGSDAYLKHVVPNPPELDGQPAISLAVTHFSGDILSSATEADQSAQRGSTPADAESRISQELSERLGAERACQLAGGGAGCSGRDLTKIMLEALRQMHDLVVKPMMTAAETNDALLESAAQRMFGWMRQVELLGLSDEFEKENDALMKSLFRALENAYEKARQRCHGGDFTQVSKLLSIERFRQLLGAGGGRDALEDVDKCLRFELRFKTRIEVHERAGDRNRVDHVFDWSATVPLRMPDLLSPLSGQAGWRLGEFSASSEVAVGNCTLTSTGSSWQGGTFDVMNLSFGPAFGQSEKADPSAVELLFHPGMDSYRESGNTQCPDGSFPYDSEEAGWITEWETFLSPPRKAGGSNTSASSLPDSWLVRGFGPSADGYAELVHRKTAGARTVDERYVIVHTPTRG